MTLGENMVKISVIMPVYNVEKFLDKSINSILNQTLNDLELICVDDGSTDNSLKILNDFANYDDRIKIFSLDHQGAGNARNFALKHVTGEYIYYMDSDDILYLNSFEDFYFISKAKNLDLLIFKALNYDVEKKHYYETNYYNMKKISDFAKRKVFSFDDLGNLIFEVCETPWCKFYNAQMVINSNAKFRENSKFNDNQFHWEVLFNSKRIYFLDEYYYTRTRHSHSLTGSKDKNHICIIGVSNDIIDVFEKYNQLTKFKKMIFNLKVNWIILRYNEIRNEFKELFFTKINYDFKNNCHEEFRDVLWDKQKFIFDIALISKNSIDFDYMLEYASIYYDKRLNINDKLNKIRIWFESLKDCYKSQLYEVIKADIKNFDKKNLNNQNSKFYYNIMNSSDFINYENKFDKNSDYSILYNEENNNLPLLINKKDKLISNLNEELEVYKSIVAEKDNLILKLNKEIIDYKSRIG